MIKVILKPLILSLLFFVLFTSSVNSQILHDNTCSSISTNYSLDWDASPSATQVDWTPQGATSFTASNIQGTGNSISFSVTGATTTLTTENGISTPGVTNSLSGGADALHISSTGLTATEEIELTMTFTPALGGNISFDIYNVIELLGGGAGGQQIEIFGLTTGGFALVPELTDNGSPSWELEGPGVVDGNATSTAGTNDQIGVNFRSINNIQTIHVILRRCSNCGQAANTEFAIGDIDICLTPDTDQDGIPDTQDADDDNDGILDVIERCPATDRVLADWDNYTYTNGDASNTYALPDGTNMTVAVASNGASIVAGETNSDLTGGLGGGTVGLFLNGNQNLQVNSIDVSFKWDQAIDSLEYTIFDVDQLGGQYIDSVTIIGFFDGFVVFPNLTGSANNTASTNRAIGDVSTADNLGTANLDVAFTEPIDSMVIFYGNASAAPAAPGNQWITIHDFSYIGDCGSPDTDGDGVPDFLDIDADNDGIVDYIEWQGSTASPIAPAGADADMDGIDDNFESATTPVDTDSDGIPDFQDPDSDNDGDLDQLEGYDTNNNGTANTLPSGTDTDTDGLDDNFDNQAGFNSTTNITNNGQTSSSFPNLDEAITTERDWREDNDFDGDGIQNYDDIDDDNDGILDVNEGRGTNNPNGDEDGDGIQNWSDVTDNGNGGDGSTTDYTDSNSDGIPDVYDADGDGQPNHLDLDSDGDGIADIVEAGGIDTDGNGIVDGAFTDGDMDGWSNVFDSDDGGTALTDVDQDADGLQNHIDIDADDDGIVDLIESQASTGTPIIPSGVDSDGDGIDNNFDTDNGNILTTPVNTESFDLPDYLDLNSDNDLDSDQLEAYDTNNDGTANTLPAGTDTDNDGLDDNFDNLTQTPANSATTNITNNGQTSNSFPNLDVVGTTELDWRETGNIDDNDGDGITNAIDIDDDNDGILDVDESTCSAVVNATVGGTGSFTVTSDGTVDISINGGDGGGAATPGGSGATVTATFSVSNGDIIRYVVGAGSTGAAANSAGGAGSTGLFINNDLVMVAGGGAGGDNSGGGTGLGASATETGVSGPGGGAGGVAGAGGGANTAGGGGGINSAGGSASGGGGAAADLVPGDGVTFVAGGAASGGSTTAGASGFTGGGGAATGDFSGGGGGYSGGGAAGPGTGAGGGGSFLNTVIASHVSGTITAGVTGGGGAANTTGADGFVTISLCASGDTDNDGIIDQFDLDSDGDGIPDIVEAGGTDADGNGIVDGVFTDGDNDGWSNVFDSDDGGTALTDPDTDADGFENRIDIDSDDDGIIDIIESQPSGVLISPSGTDSDADGIDDNFDPDSGNSLTTPENTDGTDNPDYTDTDSDNDGDLDILEGHDTDNDGVADTTPAGADADNDGLDDNFDNIVGPNNTTNVTNNNQNSSSFPDLDRPTTPERDWREDMDNDGDGIVDLIDIDDDNDGILDVDEGFCFSGEVVNMVASGVGTYTVLGDGQATISMNGGDGGGGSVRAGGSAATITNAVFNVTEGDVIRFVVGAGSVGTATGSAGGGGSTGLFINNTLMMVTGGGGGGDNSGVGAIGLGGNVGTGGDSGTGGNGPGAGGVGGAGGGASNTGSAGGGGINSAGTSSLAGGGSAADLVPSDGVTLVTGGAASGAGNTAGASGFTGGGGAAAGFNSGGAGGYSGGGAAGDAGGAGGGGSFINTGAPEYVSGSVTAGVDGGGAAAGANGADGFVIISTVCTIAEIDTDNDGVPNHLDPDSDGDGIADIIEAGGVDADGNGIVDGVFADGDNDGWSNVFDSDDGGTALTDPDTDGDGFENRIDIDADDDGIIDIVESQPSGVLISPSGTDTDGDGIDDNFDPDSGNTLTTPENTDGADNPDYTDTDSDNDGDLDVLEGHDTDNDGIADTTPAGTDADNDGLDDNFDVVVGPNSTTNVTNGGQASAFFPNLDNVATTERDWREILDNDNDGITNINDVDDDNDGILDIFECPATYRLNVGSGVTFTDVQGRVWGPDGAFVSSGSAGVEGTTITNLNSGHEVGTTSDANIYSLFRNPGAVGSLDYTLPVANGDYTVVFHWGDGFGNGGSRLIDISLEGVTVISNYAPQNEFGVSVAGTRTFTTTVSDGVLNVSHGGSGTPILYGLEVFDACDVDNDGIVDKFDLDSDNDGIPDIVEAGGEDTDGNGKVDDINTNGTLTADSDNDGLADVYDANNGGTAISLPDTDGDGVNDSKDLDADNDGIPDVVEAGGVDENGDGRSDDYVDTDEDGFNDVVDGDVGQDGTSENTANALSVTGSDTDNDGAPNSFPNDDADGDGIVNQLDLDADNDGIADVVEAGGTDVNGDGRADDYADADGDGFNDVVDGDPTNALAVGSDANGANTTDALLITGSDTDNDGAPNTNPEGDLDGDNVYNFLDLDSDDDGILDVTEAGGTDADRDGIADSFVDADNDGFNDVVDGDPDNSLAVGSDATDSNLAGVLTATGDDTDGDGAPNSFPNDDFDGDNRYNYLDIDADNDGIVDNTEGQSTAGYIAPANADADGDGIDDAYDANDASFGGAGSSFVLSDIDAAEEPNSPDYLDLNSDNDFFTDAVEGHDSDGNGVADAGSPANTGLPGGVTDSDGDGLLDGYDNNTSSTDPTNTNLQGTSHPNVGNSATAERDWREIPDKDNDGIADQNDIDKDNDGILDREECLTTTTNEISGGDGGSTTNFSQDGVTSVYFDVLSVDNSLSITVNGGNLNANNIFQLESAPVAGEIFVEFTSDGAAIATPWLTNSNGLPRLRIFIDENGQVSILGTRATTSTALEFMQPRDGSSFNTISFLGGTNNFSVVNQDGGGPDAISAQAFVFSSCDTDSDGIPDYCDLDSDNDGIADIIEAGGVDADGNGVVDVFVDSDNDGFADALDPLRGGTALADGDQDGDGFQNRIDIDADNDGIADIVEAGGTDADGDGRTDVTTDTDADGWANTFDSDDGGTILPVTNTDGDNLANYLDLDSDSDGIIDNIEGQSTGGFQAPLGTDTDMDGWDNRYDSDDGGTAITLSNIDNANDAIPDYLDQNTDNDAQPDWLEGFDDDEDGDALMDFEVRANAYETTAGNPGNYVFTDDADMDGVPNFLEDTDGDNIANFLDPDSPFFIDTDNDGLIDLYDGDNNGAVNSTPTSLSNIDADAEPDFRDVDNDVTLPIELLNFTATKVGDAVQLDWITLTEINNDFFTIERSLDGVNFEGILTEPGAGNSNIRLDYRRFDEDPKEGFNYYRLRQTDYDGNTETFNIEVVEFRNGNEIGGETKLYPNPTSGEELYLEIIKPSSGKCRIEMMDINGRLIKEQEFNTQEGVDTYRIELLEGISLAGGEYYVRIITNDKIENIPFVVR